MIEQLLLPGRNGSGRLQMFLEKNRHDDLIAIFDVGGRSCKLLVAPRHVPAELAGNLFNDGSGLFEMANDAGYGFLPIRSSPAFERMCGFVSQRCALLHTIPDRRPEIRLVATAPYRGLENRQEVSEHLERATGLRARFLTDREEAYLLACAVMRTCNVGRRSALMLTPSATDALVVLDQGGDSMAVTCTRLSCSSEAQDFSYSFIGELGSLRLGDTFLTRGTDGTRVDPKNFKTRIRNQFQVRYREHVRELASSVTSVPANLTAGVTLHAYGLGSAMTGLATGAGHEKHNKVFSLDELTSRLEKKIDTLEASVARIPTLHEKLPRDEDVQKDFVMMCGLTAFIEMLRKLGLEEIRLAGYGLRFGVYIYLCQLEKKL